MNKLLKSLKTNDVYTLFMIALYTFLAIMFSMRMENFWGVLILNISLIGIIFYVSSLSFKYANRRKYELFRSLYIFPVIFIIYSQVQEYIPFLNPSNYDMMLASWDRLLCGANPTEWIYKFSNPFLTEYLQFSYMSYYFIPVILGIELGLRDEKTQLDIFLRNVIFAFYLSYLAYFFMPAIGPRFLFHDFLKLSNELPGVLLTEFFRNVVNIGGGVPPGALNPADFVNKDCMPSGHTWITIVNIYMSFKLNSKFKYFILFIGLSLILATVYLRYHYVVDLIAGAILAIISIKTEPYLNKYIQKKIN